MRSNQLRFTMSKTIWIEMVIKAAKTKLPIPTPSLIAAEVFAWMETAEPTASPSTAAAS